MRKRILTACIVVVIGIVTTLVIGYITVEPYTGVFFLLIGLSFAIVVVLLLRNIMVAIFLLIVLSPIAFGIWFTININIGTRPFVGTFLIIDVMTVIIAPCLMCYKSTVKGKSGISGKKMSPDYLNILLLIFVGWVFLSILWSPSTICGLHAGALFAIHLLIGSTFIALIKVEQDLKMAVKTFIVTAIIIAITMLISILPVKSLDFNKIYFIADWLSLKVFFNGNDLRATGLTDEKTAAEYVGIGIVGSLLLLSNVNDKKIKLLLTCLLILFSFAFLFGQAKSAAIGLLIGLLTLSIVINKFRAHFIRNLFRFVAVFIVIFGIFLATQSILLSYREINKEQTLPTLFASSSQAQESVDSRLTWWKICYNEIDRNNAYLYGLGIGGCGYTINIYEGTSALAVANPHSVYLSIFFDLGVIGFSLFLFLLLLSAIKIYYLIRNLKDGSEKDMLLAFLCCTIITGAISFTETSYYQTISIPVLLGIGVSAYRVVALKRTEQ